MNKEKIKELNSLILDNPDLEIKIFVNAENSEDYDFFWFFGEIVLAEVDEMIYYKDKIFLESDAEELYDLIWDDDIIGDTEYQPLVDYGIVDEFIDTLPKKKIIAVHIGEKEEIKEVIGDGCS